MVALNGVCFYSVRTSIKISLLVWANLLVGQKQLKYHSVYLQKPIAFSKHRIEIQSAVDNQISRSVAMKLA